MEPLDIIFVTLILILAIRSALRGFVAECMSLASVVVGLLGAACFYKAVGAFIRDRYVSGVFIPDFLAFVLIFLFVFLAIKFLELLLRDILERTRLGGLDRFLGFFVGVIEGLVLAALLLLFLSSQPFFDAQPLLERSLFARVGEPYIGRWFGQGRALLEELFSRPRSGA